MQPKRVGHGGASALAPANTLASFDAANAVGVDVIEFDVRAGRRPLVLAHTRLHALTPRCPSLEDALRHLCRRPFRAVELNIDLKHPGCEAGTIERLRRTGCLERTVISSQWVSVVDRVREIAPDLRVGISIGGRIARQSRRWRDWRRVVLDGLSEGRFNALMAQHRLIDRPLVDAVRAAGGELYAWTVNDGATLERLIELGVDAIVTGDPRLFQPSPRSATAAVAPGGGL